MAKKSEIKDIGSERALIGTIIKNGKDAFIDIDGLIDEVDFYLDINRIIYCCIQALYKDEQCESFDTELIKLKANSLGYEKYFENGDNVEYLETLSITNFDVDNINIFAIQVKKYSIVRNLMDRYGDVVKYLSNISGNESINDILAHVEGCVTEFINGIDGEESFSSLTSNISEHIQAMIDAEPVDQVGIPTGFPIWDEAIGGGPRKGTIAVIGARPKCGKSFLALNMARNVAMTGVPVLYLDTELTPEYQQDRLVSIHSGCPLIEYETGRFQKDKDLVTNVKEAGKELAELPMYYRSIAGMDYKEAMTIMRRWIAKTVGFNAEGHANDCVIIYDYFKLTGESNLNTFTPEHIALGLMLTGLHNLAVRFRVPIIGFVQLNREGIDGEATSVIAGSDRILWLCSSMSILKNKDATDIEGHGCGWEFGNKKLLVLETRQGSGLENPNDYINLHASLNPNVSKIDATGLITEGLTLGQISSQI